MQNNTMQEDIGWPRGKSPHDVWERKQVISMIRWFALFVAVPVLVYVLVLPSIGVDYFSGPAEDAIRIEGTVERISDPIVSPESGATKYVIKLAESSTSFVVYGGKSARLTAVGDTVYIEANTKGYVSKFNNSSLGASSR